MKSDETRSLDKGQPDLATVLDEYLAEMRTGRTPSKEDWLLRHPDLCTELEECLASLEMIGQAAFESESSTGADIPVTQILGDFRIIGQIGSGGMGVVYEAEQMSLGRRVALKVLPFASVLDPRQLQRFKLESQVAALLHHQHIVPIYQVGCERGVHFYAMQYVDGSSLDLVIRQLRQARQTRQVEDQSTAVYHQKTRWAQSFVQAASSLTVGIPAAAATSGSRVDATGNVAVHSAQNSGRVSSTVQQVFSSTAPLANVETHRWTHSPAYMKTVASLGIQACSAIEHAHQHGVIHRDIKPSNLLLDERGQLWITDFGLARMGTSDRVTQTGDILGTLRYMSPEQALAEHAIVDERTDIYSLGATLYELLTLQPVFDGTGHSEILRQIVSDDPRPLRSINSRIPRELEMIVLKALGKTPAERYSSCAAMGQDLQRYLDDLPVLARRPTLLQRSRKWARRHRTVVFTTLIFAFMLLALVSFLSMRSAFLLREQRNVALSAVEDSNRQLWQSYIERIRSQRSGLLPGRQFKSRETILKAVELGERIGLSEADVALLRTEAIACQVISGDVKQQSKHSFDSFSWFVAFDENLELFARTADPQQGGIEIRRTADQKLVSRLPEFGLLLRLMMNNDGSLLVLVGGSGNALIWSVEQNRFVAKFDVVSPRAFALSDSDGLMCVATPNHGVQISNAADGSNVRSLPVRISPNVIQFDLDSNLVCLADRYNVEFWDIGQEKRMGGFECEVGIRDVISYEQGQKAFVLGEDMRVYHWNRFHGLIRPFSSATVKILEMKYCNQTRIMGLDTASGYSLLVSELTGHELMHMPYRLSRFSGDGQALGWNTSYEAGVDQIGVANGLTISNFDKLGFAHLIEGPGGRWYAGASDRGIVVWESTTGQQLAHLAVGQASGLHFDGNTNELIVGGNAGITRWPVEERGDALHIGPARTVARLPLTYCDFFRDNQVAICDQNRALVVDLLNDPKEAIELIHPLANHVSVSPDHRFAVTGTYNGSGVKVWDLATRNEVIDLWPQFGHGKSRFSPDGKYLLVSRGWAYRLYRVGSWEMVWQLPQEGTSDSPSPIAFAPDGKRVMLRLTSRAMQLVDVETGNLTVEFQSPLSTQGMVSFFSGDGKYFFESNSDGLVLRWDLDQINHDLVALGLEWREGSELHAPATTPLQSVSIDYGGLFARERLQEQGRRIETETPGLLPGIIREFQRAFDR